MYVENISYYNESVLFISNYIFDMFLHDFLITFSNGFKCVLPHKNIFDNDKTLSKLLTKHKITLLFVTNTLLNNLNIEPNSHTKILKIAGEKLNQNLIKKIKNKLNANCKLFNLYGTTETTIVSCFKRIDNNIQDCLIGNPIKNQIFFVLNKSLKPIPLNNGVKFHAPIPPSFIHWPSDTSSNAYGMPTTIELTKNGSKKAPFLFFNLFTHDCKKAVT